MRIKWFLGKIYLSIKPSSDFHINWRKPFDDVTEATQPTMIHLHDLDTKEKSWGYAGGILCNRKDHPLEKNEYDYIVNPGDTTSLSVRKLFLFGAIAPSKQN